MSRALIETLLRNDATLAGLGISDEFVSPQHDLNEVPRQDGLFIVVRWEESTLFNQNYTGMGNGISRAPRVLTLWVHSPRKFGTNFELIDQVIDRIDDIFAEIEDEPGTDGYSITTIRNSGRSGDLDDEVLNTVTRNAAYTVLYRRT